ncbi:RNA polymerase sigma factor [Mucilaginibacter ginsenosidivorans]|uniref:Sigma-70 family RNA polymerase sigma factor n=1 Tax=Mucilaginibacter ginsenosidivorans TaxID=398053 RepID=A0A5B8USC7_9SPHI|nr:sigma-70 family RNA polymerase sigma factor [Mucilaginibacter ginsenosidivorans]QEC61980.1 sigma-70 family RNA polymerase sigma factor [Mucilaginibacter ginsenosidivorans]
MIKNNEGEWRTETIKRLQKQLSNCDSAYYSKVYEIALDFALNTDRVVGPNFYFRVVNDAKRTLRRNKPNSPSIISLYMLSENGDEEIDNPLIADYATPEQEVIYRQSVELLRRACSQKHKHSVSVFYSMLEGYTVIETAKKLGISDSMVKKLRSDIIRLARIILLN